MDFKRQLKQFKPSFCADAFIDFLSIKKEPKYFKRKIIAQYNFIDVVRSEKVFWYLSVCSGYGLIRK